MGHGGVIIKHIFFAFSEIIIYRFVSGYLLMPKLNLQSRKKPLCRRSLGKKAGFLLTGAFKLLIVSPWSSSPLRYSFMRKKLILQNMLASDLTFYICDVWYYCNFRRSSPEDVAISDDSDVSELTQEKLTKEEWQAINNLLSYQPDGELSLYSGKDGQNMVQFLVDVSIGQAAAKIIDIHGTEVLCGRFELLNVSTKLKPRSTCCDLSLRFYGLYAPEGSLAQVASSFFSLLMRSMSLHLYMFVLIFNLFVYLLWEH